MNRNAPVKLFCPHPPSGSPGVRGKMFVINKGGTLTKKVKKGRALINEKSIVIN